MQHGFASRTIGRTQQVEIKQAAQKVGGIEKADHGTVILQTESMLADTFSETGKGLDQASIGAA